jgi:hypothetical protein
MFKLTKLHLDPDKQSMLPAGYSSTMPMASLFNAGHEERIPVESVKDVKVGYQLLLTAGFSWHNTSQIREIVSLEDKRVVFKTQTSTYELIEL